MTEQDKQALDNGKTLLGKPLWLNRDWSLQVCPTKRVLLEDGMARMEGKPGDPTCTRIRSGRLVIKEVNVGGTGHQKWYYVEADTGQKGWLYGDNIDYGMGKCWGPVVASEPSPVPECHEYGLPLIGMDEDAVLALGRGKPDKKQVFTSQRGVTEIWKYPGEWVYLHAGFVYMVEQRQIKQEE